MYGKSILLSLIMVLLCTMTAFGVTSITFTFANGQITGTDTKYYEFDVVAAAGTSGTKIGLSIVYINYNTARFGSSIKTHNKITVTKGPLTQGNYMLVVNDNTSSRVSILMDYEGAPNAANELLTTPTQWAHVKIEIADPSKTAGLSFQQDKMVGQEYESNLPKYNPVIVSDSDDSSLPVNLSSFTASADDTKVTLKWETGSEVGNIGFYVYRGETADGPFEKISKLIEGAGNSAMGRTYEYIDREVELSKTYFYYLEDIDIHSVRNKSDTIQVTMKPPLPKEYKLFQNYPNPFNPETWIPFQLPKAGEVTIRIYNTTGQLVKTIQLGYKQADMYVDKSKAAYWDGRNNMGEKLASGAYFYELRAGAFRSSRKMLLLK